MAEDMKELDVNEGMFQFIESHQDDDVNKLRLKRRNDAEFDMDFAITQIECRRHIRRKLPEICADRRFLFPSVLATEQATCEIIAKYHASIIGEVDSVLDMTSGLCIDDYYIAGIAKRMVSIEMNEQTARVSAYNMSRLRPNIEVVNGNSIDYIKRCSRRFSAVFIDPARRGDNQSRLYGLSDCEPDVLSLLKPISAIAPILYVKASPMLDVTQVLREVPDVSDVWVVSHKNECKELFFKVVFPIGSCVSADDGLCITGDDASVCAVGDGVMLHCVNFDAEDRCEELSLPYSSSRLPVDRFASCVGKYLYEPNASIMKAGAFAAVAREYSIIKIAIHSHLFTSDELCEAFPGRTFKVESVYPFKDKVIKTALKGEGRMNVSVRNFKLTAEQLKSRLKLSDGGDKYLFGTTNADGDMVVIVCSKVKIA